MAVSMCTQGIAIIPT